MVDEEAFFQWYNFKATPDDKALYERVGGFSNLFEDMLFKRGTSSYGLTKYQIKNDDDTSYEVGGSLPDELEYFDYCRFRFKAEKPNDCNGFFDRKEKVVCVPPDAEDSTVLHEMIHLHEFIINEIPMYWHDILYWALYKDLKNNIPNLDEIITQHAHVLNEADLYEEGGLHDILFLLKSFDLDIRMGYSLGTVFGYDRVEFFKKYNYIIDS